MKKTIIALAAVICSLGIMTSCGDTKRCWEITATYSIMGVSQSSTIYVFGTRNDVDAAIDKAKQTLNASGIGEINFTRKYIMKSQEDCEALNNK